MARRSGRPGEWLATDDITGFTEYASTLRRDYWGNMTRVVLQRNLQEIASPLDDPEPVPFFRGASYEFTPKCIAEIAPTYVGNTNVPTSQDNMAFQVLNLNPAIPDMEIGCTFVVR